MFVFIWLRTSLPRLRYDQFMGLGWKVLIPISLVWVMVVATLRVAITDSTVTRAIVTAAVGVVSTMALLLVICRVMRPPQPLTPPAAGPQAAVSGGFPVPPIPSRGSQHARSTLSGRSSPSAPTPENPRRETTDV